MCIHIHTCTHTHIHIQNKVIIHPICQALKRPAKEGAEFSLLLGACGVIHQFPSFIPGKCHYEEQKFKRGHGNKAEHKKEVSLTLKKGNHQLPLGPSIIW